MALVLLLCYALRLALGACPALVLASLAATLL